jgi:hypothetical protein
VLCCHIAAAVGMDPQCRKICSRSFEPVVPGENDASCRRYRLANRIERLCAFEVPLGRYHFSSLGRHVHNRLEQDLFAAAHLDNSRPVRLERHNRPDPLALGRHGSNFRSSGGLLFLLNGRPETSIEPPLQYRVAEHMAAFRQAG